MGVEEGNKSICRILVSNEFARGRVYNLDDIDTITVILRRSPIQELKITPSIYTQFLLLTYVILLKKFL